MKRKRLAILSAALALALILTLVIGCDEEGTESGELKGVVTVLHAGSLAVPFSEMEDEFEEMYPGVDVQCESDSSGVTIRKVTELGLNAEVVASADYALIPELMYPDYADWYVTFATNQMVLCYTDKSMYADEITSDNWYEILLRDGVEYAHSDLLDPCGYRTLLVWQLAEEYYNQPGLYEELVANCPEKNIRPKSVQLVALLESGEIDYASEYVSVAIQHDLQYVEYPPEIDLSDIAFEDYYAQSTVDIPGTEPGTTIAMIGAPVVYGVTIPTNTENPDLAIAFMEYLLGDKGQAVMSRNCQTPIAPALADDLSKLPAELQPYAVQAQ
jgi:molybdate/tungstate transport system substrate-binding protein